MNTEQKWISPMQARKLLDISSRTLLNWDYGGKVTCIRTPAGHRRYLYDDIIRLRKSASKQNVCYCRVSTYDQKEDMERQVELFKLKFPHHEIIKDIGSGLNFQRKGFNAILEYALKGNLGEVVVTRKDRLCRFGFELFENVIKASSNGKIVVLNKETMSAETELVNDIISIITVFSSRLYGMRSKSVKREIEKVKDFIKTDENTETTNISD